ncbi:MAG: DUF3391 domain-containing protein, partial [Tepidimonas sp.]
MLKRIHVEDVRLGMFIHGFAGSWLDHPFWRNRFLLEDPEDLARIRASAVREVWIDVSQGADVPPEVPVAEAVEAPQDTGPLQACDERVQRLLEPVSQSVELQRAARLLASARGAVKDMFQDSRMGRAIDRQVMHSVAVCALMV